MKLILFQYLWSSAAFTGVLKAFGPYPEDGFGISCAGRSFLHEGMEVPLPTGPPELWSLQWGPDAGSGVGGGLAASLGSVLSAGLVLHCWEMWLHHSSPLGPQGNSPR